MKGRTFHAKPQKGKDLKTTISFAPFYLSVFAYNFALRILHLAPLRKKFNRLA